MVSCRASRISSRSRCQPIELGRRHVDQPAGQQARSSVTSRSPPRRVLEVRGRGMREVADRAPPFARRRRELRQPVLGGPPPVGEHRTRAAERQRGIAGDVPHVEQTQRDSQVVAGCRPELALGADRSGRERRCRPTAGTRVSRRAGARGGRRTRRLRGARRRGRSTVTARRARSRRRRRGPRPPWEGPGSSQAWSHSERSRSSAAAARSRPLLRPRRSPGHPCAPSRRSRRASPRPCRHRCDRSGRS